jgi:hypothetical protein
LGSNEAQVLQEGGQGACCSLVWQEVRGRDASRA